MSTAFLSHLVANGNLSPEQSQCLQSAPSDPRGFAFSIVEKGWMPDKAVITALATYTGLPSCNLEDFDLSVLPLAGLPLETLQREGLLPFLEGPQGIYIALAKPASTTLLTTLAAHTSKKIVPILATPSLISAHLPKLQQMPAKLTQSTPTCSVDALLKEALDQGASDIHIEPEQTRLRVRLRCDGILQEWATYPLEQAPAMVARLKVLAQLDIAERRLPQDGRFEIPSYLCERRFDCRVSTCPTLFGEKLAIRILDPQQMQLGIDALGYSPAQKQCFLEALGRPQGLILVTGPTGSGKTVSLYTALHLRNSPNVNIATVEDPVEIYLPGINQVPIQPRIGLTFAVALRAFLRQDPDILMVGEIRDVETAEMALKAAQTGHLVLSTLHTNSAVDSILRLTHMGIPPYHIASALSLVIAQRLVRRLCPYCKEPDRLQAQAYCANPHGCTHCHGGYAGRLGLFEMLPMSPALQTLIIQGASPAALQAAIPDFIPLRAAGLARVAAGETSMAEILRVVGR